MEEFKSKQLYRRANIREKRKILLIGCEGNNKTERNYFLPFNNLQSEYRIQLASGNNTDICNIIKNIEKDKDRIGFNAKTDKIFAILDIDNSLDKIKDINNLKCTNVHKNINYIVSNPCFELWFLLHYICTTKTFNCSKDLIKCLKKYMPHYDKSKTYFNELYPLLDKAIKNNEQIIKHSIDLYGDKCLEHTYTNILDIIKLLKSAIK